MKRVLGRLDPAVPYVVVPLMVVFLFTWGIGQWMIHRHRKYPGNPVTAGTLPYLPVLVVTKTQPGSPPTCRVVVHAALEVFLEEHPDSSYLVPPSYESVLKGQAETTPPFFDSEDPAPSGWRTTFEVERRGAERQRLKVTMSFGENYGKVGWYEAFDRQVRPLRFHSYSTGGVAEAAALSAVLLLGIGFGGFHAVRGVYRRLRRPSEG